MKQEFVFAAEGGEGGAEEEGGAQGTLTNLTSAPGGYEVLVSEDELVDPERAVSAERLQGPTGSEISDALQRDEELADILSEHLEIKEIISEEEGIQELPGFPEMPE